MKKLITITILAVAALNGCNIEQNKPNPITVKDTYQLQNGDYSFQVIIIDGCQYIYRDAGYKEGATICHKGNCNNPIHKTN